MVVPPLTKSQRRSILKERRRAFVEIMDKSERDRFEQDLAERVVEHLDDAYIIAAYLPIGPEIDTSKLVNTLNTRGKTIALPHVTGRTDTPRFLTWKPGDALAHGPFGLRQPSETATAVDPDVILTPLLGFDRSLNRIGYGAGHYDRAFAGHRNARRIGLAWSVQLCDPIPADPWDVPLHAIATEREWITA